MKNKYIKNIQITRIIKTENYLAKKILKLRNQINVRKNMLNNKIIKFNEHKKCMDSLIKNSLDYLYVISIKKNVSGVLRFTKLNENEVEWSFYLDKDYQKIYGSYVEYLSIVKMFKLKNITNIKCKVFDFNLNVISLHKKFGFVIEISKKIQTRKLIYFNLSKEKWFFQSKVIKKKLRI